jgi:hypothetical protein
VVSGEIEERIGHAGSGHDRHPLAKEACPSNVQVPWALLHKSHRRREQML